jgi:hypothetical protein
MSSLVTQPSLAARAGAILGDVADDALLSGLERDRLRSLVAGDLDRASALHADDYELVTPGGDTLTKAEYLDGIASGALRYHVFEPSSPIRCRIGSDRAIIRYRVHVVIDFPGGSDDSELWHTDYWELRDERWQVVWSHATRISSAAPTRT